MRRGHPILGAVAGLGFGVFVAGDLVSFKIVRLDSIVLAVLPPAGLVLGIVLALWAPLGRGRLSPAGAPPAGEPPSSPHPSAD